MHRVKIFILLFLFVSCLLITASAQEVYQEQSPGGKVFHKLGRGLANMLTFWLELPKCIAEQWKKTDPFTGFILGSVKGVAWGWTRLVVGAYEVLTFPFPVPKNYEAVMEPEFILPAIWGEPLPGTESEIAGP